LVGLQKGPEDTGLPSQKEASMSILTRLALVALILTSAGGAAMARPVHHDRWYEDIETPDQGFSPNSTKGNWAFWDNMNGETMAH